MMPMQQMQLVHIAPMPNANMAESMHESPCNLYMPGEDISDYTILPIQPAQPEVHTQRRGNKRQNTDSNGSCESKKRSIQNRDECVRNQKFNTPAVARRNERERNRVKQVNMGFETLRQHVPQASKNKKMSKVDTLRAAVDYINQLQNMLEDTDASTRGALLEGGWSVLESAKALMSLDSCNGPVRNASVSSPTNSVQSMPSPGGYTTDGSASNIDSATSPVAHSTISFDASLENDLMDFTSWFQ